MHRIDTPTAQKDKFGAGKNGFTRGNPQTGTPATDLDDDYFDMLQEELAAVVESSGVALNKAKRDQLLTSLQALFLSKNDTIPGRLLNVTKFTSSGTYTPTAGTKSIIVEAIGGGGASGNLVATTSTTNAISSSGGNGSYAKARYTSGFSSIPVTIGAGGVVNGGGGGNGGDGGSTIFGSLLTCPGGKGSVVGTPIAPPANVPIPAAAADASGTGVIITAKGLLPAVPLIVTLGNVTNFANLQTTLMGSFGRGGDGRASNTDAAAASGNVGSAGCVIIWEYA